MNASACTRVTVQLFSENRLFARLGREFIDIVNHIIIYRSGGSCYGISNPRVEREDQWERLKARHCAYRMGRTFNNRAEFELWLHWMSEQTAHRNCPDGS